jgi:hypothetical protein
MSRAKVIAKLVEAGHADLAEQLIEGAPGATIDNRYLTSLILDPKRLEEAVEQAKSSSFKAIYLFAHVAAALKDIGKEQGKEAGAGALKLAADIEKGVKALRAADRKLPSDMHLRSALKTTSQDLAKKDQAKDLKRQFQAFLNDFVVKYVDDTYEGFLKHGNRKEPCITAAYIKGDMDQASLTGVWGFPREFDSEWDVMLTKEKLSMLSSALATAVRKGKLSRSTGMSGSREAYCYEPNEKNLAKLQQRYGG